MTTSDQTVAAPQLAIARADVVSGALEALPPRVGADVVGNPQRSGRETFNDGKVQFGVWEATPGSWNVERRHGAETVYLLSGRVRITTKGGQQVEFHAGDSFVTPDGWSGRWEVIETVRKVFTTYVG